MPRDTLLEPAKTISLPSRQSDRQIPCRIIYPTSGSPSGVMLHMHGGGWVLMTHTSSDPLIQRYADASNSVVVSVGYRLAPEYSFPAGPEDCIDCAEYLMENAPQEYGGALRFIGGEVRPEAVLTRQCLHRLISKLFVATSLSGVTSLYLHYSTCCGSTRTFPCLGVCCSTLACMTCHLCHRHSHSRMRLFSLSDPSKNILKPSHLG